MAGVVAFILVHGLLQGPYVLTVVPAAYTESVLCLDTLESLVDQMLPLGWAIASEQLTRLLAWWRPLSVHEIAPLLPAGPFDR